MKIRLILLFTVAMFLPKTGGAHEFYVSITTIRHQLGDETVAVKMRIFTDDLENAVRNYCGSPLNLNTAGEISESDSLINAYLLAHFSMNINGEVCRLNFLDKRYDLDVTECRWEVPSPAEVRSIGVHSDVLLNVLDAQTNIVRIKVGDTQKIFNLNSALRDGEAHIE